jgi:hypothetical protein
MPGCDNNDDTQGIETQGIETQGIEHVVQRIQRGASETVFTESDEGLASLFVCVQSLFVQNTGVKALDHSACYF